MICHLLLQTGGKINLNAISGTLLLNVCDDNGADTHDGFNEGHYKRLKKQAKLAEEAIYRNVELKKPTLEMDKPKEIREEPKRPILTLPASPEIYQMKSMPLADSMQWLLDDDEDAILWLLQ